MANDKRQTTNGNRQTANDKLLPDSRRTIVIFLIALGIVNLIQAALTPLHNDEAYYWMYSRYPAFGYYDHPPMIALFIGLGYSLFKSEIGVRLLIVLAQAATILLAWMLAEKDMSAKGKPSVTFILLVLLMPMFHVYGFIATPDVPLLLFSALFLVFYRRFLVSENLTGTIFLGISMAGLVYSKYHGALLILLVIASYPRLLLKTRFYAASLLALILFLPHIFWQIKNDFPSLQYHLVDRVSGPELSNVPEYVLNQFFVHNPVLLTLVLFLIFRTKAAGQFERTLRVVIAGTLGFFFISSFRYHVEPHWTAMISVPVLILLFNRRGEGWNQYRVLKTTALLVLPLILAARLVLVFDLIPLEYLEREFHGTETRVARIKEVAKDRPVVFTNSYQDPSQYTFHTGITAHTLNNLAYRRTQFDIWDFEEKLKGSEVLYVPHWLSPDYKKNLQPYPFSEGDTLWARVISDFQSLQRRCVILADPVENMTAGDTRNIELRIFNPYPYPLLLNHKVLPVKFQAAFFRDGRLKAKNTLFFSDLPGTIMQGDTVTCRASFVIPGIDEGEYIFAITSEAGFLLDVISSNPATAIVSEREKQ